MPTDDSKAALQFQTAEFEGTPTPAGDVCCICRVPVSSGYYHLNGNIACAACSERITASMPRDTHAASRVPCCWGWVERSPD